MTAVPRSSTVSGRVESPDGDVPRRRGSSPVGTSIARIIVTVFNYDWFTGPAFEAQKQQARQRCARRHFPEITDETAATDKEYLRFLGDLEIRTLIYLRDGFSYEMKDRVSIGLHSEVLTFECEPVDEQYKVGSFIVSVPYDELIRVEVFAVHPSEKPEDVPLITGFRTGPHDPTAPRDDARDSREPRDEVK